MADISKIVLPNGDQHTIKDSTARSGLNNKVDKVTGKGLSTNDYTTTEKDKLAGIAAGAEANVQSDWNVTDSASDAFIKNKPTIPTDTWKAFYGTCSTAAATAEKSITVSSDQNFSLKVGAVIGVKFTVSNTASNVKLNVNSTGAKSIWYNTSVYTGKSTDVCGYANRVYYYLYDGTHWCWIGFGIQPNSNTIPTAYCTTAAGTAAKTATCTNYNLLAKSYTILLISTTNTAASALTLNINGKGAKPIYINGTASSASNHTMPAGSYLVYYDGTNYYIRTDGKITGDITGDAATVNGKTVGVNVPADAKFTDTVVTKTSELTNDSHFAVDANYVHTDNNYTSTEKTKLAGIAAGAEVNVQSDWNVTDSASDAFIKNKPTIPTDAVVNITRDGTTFTATKADGTSFTFDQQDNDSMPHYSVTESELNSKAGNYTFSGDGSPWAGTDWVGLQVGDSKDKFQLTVRENGRMSVRQNDSGGTDTTNWTAWGDFFPNASAIKNITRSGTTFTATRLDGSTFTFTQQDNNSVTGVKGNAESSYRTGNVNLTPANIGAAAASHTHSYYPLTGGVINGDIYLCPLSGTGTYRNLQLYNGSSNSRAYIHTTVSNSIPTVHFIVGGFLNLQSSSIQCRNYSDSAWSGIAASNFSVQSTKRVKENVLDITDDRAKKLLDINVVTYDYKEGVMEESDRFDRTGVIAEDVNDIIPEVVGRDADGVINTVDYSRFVPYLIRMVQIQQKQIEEIKLLIKERRD